MKELTDKEKETLEKIREQVEKAFSLIDIDVLNSLVLPHGKHRAFTSVDEYIDITIRRTRNWLQITDLSPSTGFEEE